MYVAPFYSTFLTVPFFWYAYKHCRPQGYKVCCTVISIVWHTKWCIVYGHTGVVLHNFRGGGVNWMRMVIITLKISNMNNLWGNCQGNSSLEKKNNKMCCWESYPTLYLRLIMLAYMYMYMYVRIYVHVQYFSSSRTPLFNSFSYKNSWHGLRFYSLTRRGPLFFVVSALSLDSTPMLIFLTQHLIYTYLYDRHSTTR